MTKIFAKRQKTTIKANAHQFNYNYLVWRLHEGVQKNHYYVVKHLVGQMDADTRDALKNTPLHQVKIKHLLF